MFGFLYPVLYFAPTLYAVLTKKSQTSVWIVAVVNLLTGWTILGWFVAWYFVFRRTLDAVATASNQPAQPAASQSWSPEAADLRACSSCGGAKTERCPSCWGNRGTTVLPQTEHGTSQWVQCTYCIGAGTITCQSCNGRGYAM